jgi:Maltokinase N-terminal cap domain
MAVIHNTTLHPSKLELLARWLPEQDWFRGAGYRGTAELTRAGGFRLDDPAGEVGIEFMVVLAGAGQAYLLPMTYRAAPLEDAEGGPIDGAALIGTAQHGVLGPRWIYDGEHDPVLRAQLAALLRGEVLAQAQSQSDTLDPTVQVRPAAGAVAFRRLLAEDQPPEPPVGYVSVPWRRLDGSSARGVVATAGR